MVRENLRLLSPAAHTVVALKPPNPRPLYGPGALQAICEKIGWPAGGIVKTSSPVTGTERAKLSGVGARPVSVR